jgi:septal ring factor EnvC (AmiA/AmiB activator)
MTYSTNPRASRAVFDDEFALLDDLERDSSRGCELAEPDAQTLAAELEQTAAERDGVLRQLADANAREGNLNSTILGLRHELGEAGRERDALREALARVVAAVMHGAPDPLADALDALEATGGIPALTASSRLALGVAA